MLRARAGSASDHALRRDHAAGVRPRHPAPSMAVPMGSGKGAASRTRCAERSAGKGQPASEPLGRGDDPLRRLCAPSAQTRGGADVSLVIRQRRGRLSPVLGSGLVECGRAAHSRSGGSEYLLNRQQVRLRDLVGAHSTPPAWPNNAFLLLNRRGHSRSALPCVPERAAQLFQERRRRCDAARRGDGGKSRGSGLVGEARSRPKAQVRTSWAELRPQAPSRSRQLQRGSTCGRAAPVPPAASSADGLAGGGPRAMDRRRRARRPGCTRAAQPLRQRAASTTAMRDVFGGRRGRRSRPRPRPEQSGREHDPGASALWTSSRQACSVMRDIRLTI